MSVDRDVTEITLQFRISKDVKNSLGLRGKSIALIMELLYCILQYGILVYRYLITAKYSMAYLYCGTSLLPAAFSVAVWYSGKSLQQITIWIICIAGSFSS
jgi:hypothetical protein